MNCVDWRWLGRIGYRETLEAQRHHRADLIAGKAKEALWLLEHDPVITTGRREVADLPSATTLAQTGTELVQTERGGLATWHGPGQLVAYAIVDAWSRGLGAKGMVCAMEAGVIAYLAEQDICAVRRPGFPGVWVGKDKICAVGMHFSRGVSMHGIALNLGNDLSGFDMIQPCGITDGGITSVHKLLGTSPTPAQAAEGLAAALIAAVEAGTCQKAPAHSPKTVDASHLER